MFSKYVNFCQGHIAFSVTSFNTIYHRQYGKNHVLKSHSQLK